MMSIPFNAKQKTYSSNDGIHYILLKTILKISYSVEFKLI
ncbi:hypothetical protein IC006_2500 [Sulfuracidifex tepidarius]|uniref:Uncharacterized protein n=1 Tax=Sulfuracidifex tepidarius TaxID=1294262 RepID=A0A510E650_9CREN|nr:hypothetical protein IC006_2500 [Sulfuracidifex tepidarius]BBG27956.1 hypothetical protein IC007_2511 [Sulfuracidifex tepidarius]